MMERCPFCGSEDIYYSKKRKIFVCEDCDETFSEQQLSVFQDKEQSKGGLDLFFSYGHDKNRVLVERIKKDLEKRGHRVWIDTNEIKAGDHWRNDILNGVMKSANVIAFLSEHSTRNPGVCLDELKIAVCVKGANVKTVLLEPENRIKQPSTLSDIQWLDMSEWADIRTASLEQFESWYQEKFEELCSVIEADDSFELNGEIHTLKEKLSPYLNAEKEYRLLSKEFYGRKWVEDYIEDWQDRKKTKSLVIYGKPGSGKSAFCVNYSHYNSDVYGCFLCEWNREFSIKPHQLIRTMAFRLATKLPDYRKLLLHQLEQADNGLGEMKDDALFEFLLAYPLNHLVDGGRETGIIVVDGLDEAEKDGNNPLAAVFARCVERLPRWIRFVFTSRPEKSVISLFEGASSLNLVDDMPDGYNDIMAYLLRALSIELKSLPNRLEVLNRICELSEGVFLYTELLVDDIKNGAIDLSNPSSFPRGLSDFYRLSMERKFRSREDFEKIRSFLELLVVSDAIPEEIVINVCNYSKYAYLSNLDLIGAWVNRQDGGYTTLHFTHKSVSDWFTDELRSGIYYVDKKHGALLLARFCRQYINSTMYHQNDKPAYLLDFAREHVGIYYVLAEAFTELEQFLLMHADELSPYWKAWNMFPKAWNQDNLLKAFWKSENRNEFCSSLQREGNTSLLQWIFELVKDLYGIEQFTPELVSVYIDIVHMSGDYAGAVEIAEQYLEGRSHEDIMNSEFLAMLNVRRIHHSMFYKPVCRLIDDALSILTRSQDLYPKVTNELLFLIGGNLGVLSGDWEFVHKWLTVSEEYSQKHSLLDYSKRNARKMADYFCHMEEYEKAKDIILAYVDQHDVITGRYENYLVGALGNIYTCMGYYDEALECYESVLQYSTEKGIIGWAAHADLGIGNINYHLGNLKEAEEFASRAFSMYKQFKQDGRLSMSGALRGACESRLGTAPIKVACQKSLELAKKMQYGSCIEAIEELCNSHNGYLKLYFL